MVWPQRATEKDGQYYHDKQLVFKLLAVGRSGQHVVGKVHSGGGKVFATAPRFGPWAWRTAWGGLEGGVIRIAGRLRGQRERRKARAS